MSRSATIALAAGGVFMLAISAVAGALPTAARHAVQPLGAVEILELPPVDAAKAATDLEIAKLQGDPLPFAQPEKLAITPDTRGTWETLPDDRFVLWRLRVAADGALSLNAGFDRFHLPKGGRLVIHAADGAGPIHEFTPSDQRDHGQLWTPVILGDEMVLELTLPAADRQDHALRLIHVGKGFRYFGEELGEKAGSCNNDVVCPEGDPWRAEINSVGVYTVGGVWTCTGAMINNTAADGTPYFLTANHCGLDTNNDQSVVVYWNFQSPVCGQQGGGSLSDAQSGAIFRSALAASDFCLIELEELPDPTWDVTYAGWDRTAADPTSAIAIHHPNTDEKSISFEDDPTATTSYGGTTSPGNGTHLRVVDWDDGTTEPGSSGSPLFSPDHHIVGQLHGGGAACGNNESDWYGRLSYSWIGGGTSSTRLSDWLDPLGLAPDTVPLFDPDAVALQVAPITGLDAAGDAGGPFTPTSVTYTVENGGDATVVFTATADVAWATVAPAGGSLEPGETAAVTVSLNGLASALPIGRHDGLVTFADAFDGSATVRPIALQVGFVSTVYAWTMDDDPGWNREGEWGFGQPEGSGGEYGNPDPTAGFDGPNVFGYALGGDYANNLPERALTTQAIDCSDVSAVSLRFQRHLNVETPAYDHAAIRVSVDGSTWIDVWQNATEVTDDAWQQVEYDLSAIADGQPTVSLRWVMGATDGSWRYSGWNIDNVEIRGLQAPDITAARTPAAPSRLHGGSPNPFNPRTDVRFTLAVEGRVRLTVHDARGRVVRELTDGSLAAGDHAIAWNGRDDRGRGVGSGVYFARLEAPDGVQTAKLVMVQ